MNKRIQDAQYCRTIWEATPLPMFVVDDDARVMDLNLEAGRMLGWAEEFVLRRRYGDVFHCVHALHVPEGCGRTPFCKDCNVRNAVGAAFRGQEVARKRTRMEVEREGKTRLVDLLVTAAPFQFEDTNYALLILEDVSELMALQELLPICAGCKRIRDDQNYWHRLESYLENHLNIGLTHGLCPECTKKYFPDTPKQ